MILLLALSCLLSLGALLAALGALRAASRPPEPARPDFDLLGRLAAFERQLEAAPRDVRADLGLMRTELQQHLATQFSLLEERFGRFTQEQGGHLTGLRTESAEGRKASDEALARHVEGFSHTQTTRLGETNLAMKELRERVELQTKEARVEQKAALEAIAVRLGELNTGNALQQEQLREQMRGHLDLMRKGNEEKLDQMKGVVDEKLSATLEQRLGEKFATVSERLEAVHKGLGEMQALATDVGGLKRVLTNVKSRGGFGELRLGQLLGDMLTPDQYEKQVAVRAGAGERVDFAIKLPGRSADHDRPLWLPIDCKFPQEDFDRLHAAQERGDAAEVEACAKDLEKAVRVQAKSIGEKYVQPPHTTDFAILYLPTEGLFAEVIRRPGLVTDLQTKHKIMVTGPTTLAAILNSLQMGFRTLAIEKRSSEVWEVLGAAKAEFRSYGDTWSKLGEKLEQAQKLHEKVAVRNRAVERKLRRVEDARPEAVAAPERGPLLALTQAGASHSDDDDLADEAA